MDERYVACNVKGGGLVVFSACSHAGIINVCKDALGRGAAAYPATPPGLFGVMGGFHLSGGLCEKRIANTVRGYSTFFVLFSCCVAVGASSIYNHILFFVSFVFLCV